MLPCLRVFSGELKNGFKFIKNYKLQTKDLFEEEKIRYFRVIIGDKAYKWFTARNFTLWSALEDSWLNFRCKVINPMEAITYVGKLQQAEKDFIMNYISSFEEFRWFFVNTLSLQGFIELFLANV